MAKKFHCLCGFFVRVWWCQAEVDLIVIKALAVVPPLLAGVPRVVINPSMHTKSWPN
jgi:hypothetical protein